VTNGWTLLREVLRRTQGRCLVLIGVARSARRRWCGDGAKMREPWFATRRMLFGLFGMSITSREPKIHEHLPGFRMCAQYPVPSPYLYRPPFFFSWRGRTQKLGRVLRAASASVRANVRHLAFQFARLVP
jgi:hypothetical protein